MSDVLLPYDEAELAADVLAVAAVVLGVGLTDAQAAAVQQLPARERTSTGCADLAAVILSRLPSN